MRTLLISLFWMTNVGSVLQLLIMLSGFWIILGDAHSFVSLSVGTFITAYVPQVAWIKTVIVWLLGDVGRWILGLPILLVAPVKILIGSLIGYWAYSRARALAVGTSNS